MKDNKTTTTTEPVPAAAPDPNRGKRPTPFKCPLCDSPMVAYNGHSLSATQGVTVSCAAEKGNQPGECPAQEVFGYGKNEKEAFEIVKEKYKKS